ncbi:T9SS type A sorting domain-containing protein [Lunatibacter salilacus]|uniref:T9SS type A sorting domain-containing protein n=1 Tax=Lunatibacter salilacus TaxID=2483804 RepID=UPI00131A8BA3|nr:T9SS type A sorting domain-containing protein [Lunatibacter salilacus]
MRLPCLLVLFLNLSWASAQQRYALTTDIQADYQGKSLSMPFAGGINAAQIQTLDVNGDGSEEYIVWDINSRMLSVFRETQNGGFEHFPQASYFFPSDISGFLVLADYDGDGRKDLFTGSPFGIKAYRNVTPGTSSTPQWEEAQAFLRLDNGSNVTANSLDIPLITDIDGDGDLDILTFNFATGDYLELYRNTSMDRKGVADIDGYASAQIRWGGFEFCSCGTFAFGFTCGGMPITSELPPLETARIEHAGGHSILYEDLNGDGVRDLLMGQDLCNTLYFLPNKGTDAAPVFDEFLLELPQTGALPQFPIFHAAYMVKEKLIITTNSSEPSANFLVDYSSSLYEYSLKVENSLATNRFLQEDMFDFGENARPFFEGNPINGNLVVTANQIQAGQATSKAYQLALEEGNLRITDEDYLNLSQLQLREMSYQSYRTAGGTNLHLVTGDQILNGIPEKKIYWTAPDQPGDWKESQVPGFSLRGVDDLTFFAHDGIDYLLLGRQTGELVLFTVDFGENSLDIELVERNFLGFSDNPVNRGLTVAVVSGTTPTLLAVDQRGVLRSVTDFMKNPSTEIAQVSVGENQWMETRLGRNTWMTAVSNPFGISHDLILGTRAGGLLYFSGIAQSGNGGDETLQVKLYPNPAQNGTWILASKAAAMDIIDLSGKVVQQGIALSANRETEIGLYGMAPGVYILRLTGESREIVHRKLIVRP